MVKVVENNERICTVNLDGSECSIVFQSHYKYFTVKNESDSEVYISLKRDIVPEADGVMTVNSKESATITNMQPNVNMFFAIGSGKIQVFASNSDNFVNPFKSAPVTGSGGGVTECAAVKFNGMGIITDIVIENDHEVEVTFDYEEYDDLETIFSSTQDVTFAPHLTTYRNQYFVGLGTSEKAFGTTTTGKHTFIRNRNGKCIFDGEEISGVTLVDYPGAGTYYYTLGCRGKTTYPLKGKIYSFIIRSNSTGEVLHNFIPVVWVGTSFGAMYDTITNKSYNVSNAITAEVD